MRDFFFFGAGFAQLSIALDPYNETQNIRIQFRIIAVDGRKAFTVFHNEHNSIVNKEMLMNLYVHRVLYNEYPLGYIIQFVTKVPVLHNRLALSRSKKNNYIMVYCQYYNVQEDKEV